LGRSGWLSRTHTKYVLLSGFFLALHFWTWFESLHHTSAFRSTLLVCLNPFWIALWEWGHGEKQKRIFWIGGLIAFVGVNIMSLGSDVQDSSIWGDGLALIGGMFGAAYFIIGKKAREELDIYRYGSWTCLSCAFWLFSISIPTQTPLLPTQEDWPFLMYMALGPQLCGHIGLNYVLKYVRASFLSMLLLFEPVGAGVLAFFILVEIPSFWACVGGCVVIFGLSQIIIFSRTNAKELKKVLRVRR
jgi:drug/metabolite transporter (DMT)-like permease